MVNGPLPAPPGFRRRSDVFQPGWLAPLGDHWVMESQPDSQPEPASPVSRRGAVTRVGGDLLHGPQLPAGFWLEVIEVEAQLQLLNLFADY